MKNGCESMSLPAAISRAYSKALTTRKATPSAPATASIFRARAQAGVDGDIGQRSEKAACQQRRRVDRSREPVELVLGCGETGGITRPSPSVAEQGQSEHRQFGGDQNPHQRMAGESGQGAPSRLHCWSRAVQTACLDNVAHSLPRPFGKSNAASEAGKLCRGARSRTDWASSGLACGFAAASSCCRASAVKGESG